MTKERYLELTPDDTYFHLCGIPLSEGSIILPGNYGRIIRKAEWRHESGMRELAIEAARLARFAFRPSRFDCAFAFTEEDEARWFRSTYPGFQFHNLFRVRLKDENANSFIANVLSLPPSIPFESNWPDRYWMGIAVNRDSGVPVEPSVCDKGTLCREVLTLSPLVVEERLD